MAIGPTVIDAPLQLSNSNNKRTPAHATVTQIYFGCPKVDFLL